MNKILQQINRKIPLHAAKTSTKLLATKNWHIIGRLSRVQLFENQIVHRICQGDPEEDQMKCGIDADCCQQTWMKNVASRKCFTNLRRNLTMPPPLAAQCSADLRRNLTMLSPLASMFYTLTETKFWQMSQTLKNPWPEVPKLPKNIAPNEEIGANFWMLKNNAQP